MDYESLLGKVPGHLKNPAEFRTAGVKGKGKLAVGFGLVKTLGEEAARLGSGKALLVTDKNMVNLGIHRFAVDPLEKAGFTVRSSTKSSPNPTWNLPGGQDLTRKRASPSWSALAGEAHGCRQGTSSPGQSGDDRLHDRHPWKEVCPASWYPPLRGRAASQPLYSDQQGR